MNNLNKSTRRNIVGSPEQIVGILSKVSAAVSNIKVEKPYYLCQTSHGIHVMQSAKTLKEIRAMARTCEAVYGENFHPEFFYKKGEQYIPKDYQF